MTEVKPKRTILLIDADGIAITSALMAQKVIEWDDGMFTTEADLAQAQKVFNEQIAAIAKVVEDPEAYTEIILCWSDSKKKYFRNDIYPEYKSKRVGGVPPLCLKALLNWAKEEYNSRTIATLEADDVMGILATRQAQGQYVEVPGQVHTHIIVSIDKDMQQIPGKHLNPAKLDEGVYEVTEEEAERMLWYQVLCGDSVDGYPGCPKVGPVTANKLLDADVDESYATTAWKAYEKAGLSLQYFETQVNVARILQTRDWVRTAQAPVYWEYKVDAFA